MHFLHPEQDEHRELALEDVFLCPNYYDGSSRLQADLSPIDKLGGSHPIVSANMSAVTGKRMAETMARYGGLGVLPQDMATTTVKRIVHHIKKANLHFDTPLTVQPNASLRDIQGIILKRAHNMVVVVDAEDRPIGLLTQANLRNRDQYTPARELMSTDLVTVPECISNREAFVTMDKNRVKAVPVVDSSQRIIGILTKESVVRLELLKPNVNQHKHLAIGAAVGISTDAAERAAMLRELDVDVVVIDTAHGHQRRALEAIREVKEALGDTIPLVAGNVCTAEGVTDLCKAGADIVKVNVGPGAMCTTRMQTGAGRPTFSAVYHCVREAQKYGKNIWADGGVRHPRDVALYLAAGAARVMIGTMLSGTYESPGDIHEDKAGNLYKENYGMASARAVRERTTKLDPFEQAKKSFFREGISSSRIYIQPGTESVSAILINMITGLMSSLTYAGAENLTQFHDQACIGVQTASGFGEGQPHGRVRR